MGVDEDIEEGVAETWGDGVAVLVPLFVEVTARGWLIPHPAIRLPPKRMTEPMTRRFSM